MRPAGKHTPVHVVHSGDDHNGQVLVHQRQGAVLHLAGVDALRVDQRHLLHLSPVRTQRNQGVVLAQLEMPASGFS